MDEHIQEVIQSFNEALAKFSENIKRINSIFSEIPNPTRPPVEIKKDIKHEKNPMRLQQLNKELNESYKSYRRNVGKKSTGGD